MPICIGMHVSLRGEESTYGHDQYCFTVLNLTFDNNYARKGGQDTFLDVTDGFHNALSSETQLTTLCGSGTCTSIESVLNFGPCFDIEQLKLFSIEDNESDRFELTPGESILFQIFGWYSFGNRLDARLWAVSLSGEVKITVIKSVDGQTRVFLAFLQRVDTNATAFVDDIVDYSDGYWKAFTEDKCFDHGELQECLFTCQCVMLVHIQ